MNDLVLLHRARGPHRHRHVYPVTETLEPGGTITRTYRCGHPYDPELAKRGRNAVKRGKRIQRERISGAGMTNLLGNAENLDGISELFRGESKSVKRFPGTWWRWLKGIPHTSGQIQVLIVTEAFPKHKARSVVIVDYDDWQDLHGE